MWLTPDTQVINQRDKAGCHRTVWLCEIRGVEGWTVEVTWRYITTPAIQIASPAER